MFKKRKDPTIAVVNENVVPNEIESKIKKAKKDRQREKCANCKRCWGFFDFLKTSWKLFKEFSADTSIHGEFLIVLVITKSSLILFNPFSSRN